MNGVVVTPIHYQMLVECGEVHEPYIPDDKGLWQLTEIDQGDGEFTETFCTVCLDISHDGEIQHLIIRCLCRFPIQFVLLHRQIPLPQ